MNGEATSDTLETTRIRRGTRRMSRSALTVLLIGQLAGCASPGTQGNSPAPSAASPVDELLTLSKLESITRGRATAFTRSVALAAGDLTDAELERLVPAVQEGFDPDSLRRDVAAAITADAPEGRIEEVLAWMRSGANAQVQEIADAYSPPMPLREWLQEYTTDPPSADRVRLVARWTEARGDGDFFILLGEALDEATYRVWSAFRPDAPEFSPMRGQELRDRLDSSFMAATVSALHANETVPDDLIRGAAAEYESEAGQWFVQSYQLAVAQAVRAAAGRVLRSLGSEEGAGGPPRDGGRP